MSRPPLRDQIARAARSPAGDRREVPHDRQRSSLGPTSPCSAGAGTGALTQTLTFQVPDSVLSVRALLALRDRSQPQNGFSTKVGIYWGDVRTSRSSLVSGKAEGDGPSSRLSSALLFTKVPFSVPDARRVARNVAPAATLLPRRGARTSWSLRR